MKKIGILLILLSILFILFVLFIKKEHMLPIIITEEQKIADKMDSVCPNTKNTQRCFQKILTFYIDDFLSKINDRINENFVKKILEKHKNVQNSVSDTTCYKKVTDFATDSIAVLMDLNRDDNLKNINIKEDIRLFIKRYTIISDLIKKKISTYKVISIPDKNITEQTNTTRCVNKSLDPEQYIKTTLNNVFFKKIRELMNYNNYKNYSNEIILFRPSDIENYIISDIIDDKNSQNISEVLSEKLNIISKTISRYYCGIYSQCCYRNDCDKIKSEINNVNSNMKNIYKKRYELCIKKNKEIKKKDFNC